MGNLCTAGKSTPPEDAMARETSRLIDSTIARDKAGFEKRLSEKKVLLLGTGDAGKTTVLKQIRLMYGNAFTPDEIVEFRSALLLNAVTCGKCLEFAMRALRIPYGFDPSVVSTTALRGLDSLVQGSCEFSNENLGSKIAVADDISAQNMELHIKTLKMHPTALAAASRFKNDNPLPAAAQRIKDMKTVYGFTKNDFISPEVMNDLLWIWNDTGVQYHIPDVMNNLQRLCDPKFMPTVEDILHCRSQTTNVSETRVAIESRSCIIYDVGGQKSQRKKWAQCFDDVKAIIFVASLSGYDQGCVEDGSLNRMADSLNVFKSILNMPFFAKTDFVLFLNKIDIFQAKLERSPIHDYFSSFSGPNTFENGADFFIKKFKSLNLKEHRTIHVHLTFATNTSQISKVMKSVFYIILM
ncbi:guanine nucleotide-binding protein subunit alpha [Entophlyctis luteolus]|nr:guanine nucleotide-binding protein subunit alpha [Entophlyctis luteolus]